MTVTFDQILYGGDYNPDQWLEYPEILSEDIRLMKQARINTVSLGIFAWAMLEPEEGDYRLDWMEEIISRLYENGISVILATPSGARPHWLADRYPEVLRVNEDRTRSLFGLRHNHCYTSPAYRQKVRMINQKLAERFDSNPAVILWHISNEYGGECHCPLCQEAFRNWLREKYHTIDEVNRKWNTAFWSHTYQNFGQIESPSSIGEASIHGLYLDWRRFVSSQTADFCRWEIDSLRMAGAQKPVTTNLMYDHSPLNYHQLAEAVDIVSWDNYPDWHKRADSLTAADTGMEHDIMRSMKKQPYLMMESCPGAVNWSSVSKLKRPGVLEATSLQALAHGSDSVLYFQIRKGRGGFEKFHGAVIDHYGREDDRTYQECRRVGLGLEKLRDLRSSRVKSRAAVIFDWENRWALENAAGPRNQGMFYREAVRKSHHAFRRLGLNVDVIDMTQSLEEYKIVAAPMLYMFRAGFEQKARTFAEKGGTLILTYWSGVADEYDLTVLGGTPGGLMDVMGLRSTEIDSLYDWDSNFLVPCMNRETAELPDGKTAPAGGASSWRPENFAETYRCSRLCQLVNVTTARPLFVYGTDFYAGTPALTVNRFGEGLAYYICADAEQAFYDDVYREIAREAGLQGPLSWEIPDGVEVTSRAGSQTEYIFIQNFSGQAAAVPVNRLLSEDSSLSVLLMSSPEIPAPGVYAFSDEVKEELPPFGTLILARGRASARPAAGKV